MLHGNLAVLLVVLAVIGYLSVGAYLSVMTSIRSLREGSERLAAGDLTATIELAARRATGRQFQRHGRRRAR